MQTGARVEGAWEPWRGSVLLADPSVGGLRAPCWPLPLVATSSSPDESWDRSESPESWRGRCGEEPASCEGKRGWGWGEAGSRAGEGLHFLLCLTLLDLVL